MADVDPVEEADGDHGRTVRRRERIETPDRLHGHAGYRRNGRPDGRRAMIGNMSKARGPLALLATLALVAGACGPDADPVTTVLDDDAIASGSFNFPESILLAQALRARPGGRGLPGRSRAGPASRVRGTRRAPRPRRAGPRVQRERPRVPRADRLARPETTHAALVEALAEHGLTALDAAPAEDRNAFVVTAETAAELGVREAERTSAVLGGPHVRGPLECPSRPLCLLELEQRTGCRSARSCRWTRGTAHRRRAAGGRGRRGAALLERQGDPDERLRRPGGRRPAPAGRERHAG